MFDKRINNILKTRLDKRYLAPELIDGYTHENTDIYCLGATIN